MSEVIDAGHHDDHHDHGPDKGLGALVIYHQP